MLYPRLGLLVVRPSAPYVAAQWVPGNFLVHLAGHKGANKEDLFDYCYSIASAPSNPLYPPGKDAATPKTQLRRV